MNKNQRVKAVYTRSADDVWTEKQIFVKWSIECVNRYLASEGCKIDVVTDKSISYSQEESPGWIIKITFD